MPLGVTVRRRFTINGYDAQKTTIFYNISHCHVCHPNTMAGSALGRIHIPAKRLGASLVGHPGDVKGSRVLAATSMDIAAAVSDSEHEALVDNRSSPFTPLFSYRGGFAKVSEYTSPDGAPHPPDSDEPLAWDSLGPAPGLSSYLCFTIAQTCLSMAFLPRAVRARIFVQRLSTLSQATTQDRGAGISLVKTSLTDFPGPPKWSE
jgi:hypothetical protein